MEFGASKPDVSLLLLFRLQWLQQQRVDVLQWGVVADDDRLAGWLRFRRHFLRTLQQGLRSVAGVGELEDFGNFLKSSDFQIFPKLRIFFSNKET